jgi:Zn-dependent protease with chaperone function/predicted house-cleaning NTP pyrophosphatase (Maf/HAM1 superfamily)
VFVAATPASAGVCVPGLDCRFTVSGKDGPFLAKQVTPEKLAAADVVANGAVVGSQSLDQRSLNKGEFSGAGLIMPLTEAALRARLDQIRAKWPYRDPGPVRIRIIASAKYAPSARADRTIIVPLGLLMRARSSDEVAWVLAHEYSHIALNHFARDARQAQNMMAVQNVVMGIQTGFDLAQTRMDETGGKLRVYVVEDPKLQAASSSVWARSKDVELGLELLNQGLSRKQEDQADAAGLDLALAAGFSDEGYAQALETVDADEARLALTLKTLNTDLLQVLRASQETAKKNSNTSSWSDIGKGFLADMKRNIGQVLLDRAKDVAMRSHRPADVRRKGMASYYDKAFPDLTPPEATEAWLVKVRATSEFADAQAAVVARDKAMDLVAAQDLKGAIALLRPILGRRYGDTPFIVSATARILWKSGDYASADTLYDQAERIGKAQSVATAAAKSKSKAKTTSPPVGAATPVRFDIFTTQNIEGFREHVEMLVEHGAYAKALSVIADAKSRFGDDDAFLPYMVTIYVQTRKTAELMAVNARCAALSDPRLHDDCIRALYSPAQQAKLDQLSPGDRAKVERQLEQKADEGRRASFWSNLANSLKAPAD